MRWEGKKWPGKELDYEKIKASEHYSTVTDATNFEIKV